jgi:hypothetical protein
MAGRWRYHRKPAPVTIRNEWLYQDDPDTAAASRAMLGVPELDPEPMFLTRSEVQGVRCPRCNAGPGKSCQGRPRPRKRNHIERVRLAEETA